MSPASRKRSFQSRFIGLKSRLLSLWQSRAVILMYHRVVPGPIRDDWLELKVSVHRFERHLEFLRNQYAVVSLKDLTEQIRAGQLRAHRQVAITFDDGYRDNYLFAYPILKCHSIPAAVFLTTDAVDSGEPFWWDRLFHLLAAARASEFELPDLGAGRFQVGTTEGRRETFLRLQQAFTRLSSAEREAALECIQSEIGAARSGVVLEEDRPMDWSAAAEMGANGIDLGAHTRTHPSLSALPHEAVVHEVVGSKAAIESRAGYPVSGFAYPYGTRSDFDERVRAEVERAGFRSACTAIRGCVSARSDPLALPRLAVRDWEVEELGRRVEICFRESPK